jgi:FMN phosphatase YigB (HAD superfamily)
MKRIAFDVGQVLCHVDLDKFTTKYNQIIPKYAPKAIIQDGLEFLINIQKRVDIGESSVCSEIKSITNNHIVIKTMLEIWNDCIIPNEKVIAFKNKLIKEGGQVAIMSNMGQDHYNFIKTKHPSIFQGCKLFLSFTAHVRKPERSFYKRFLQQNPKFRGCVYLDDMIENLNTSKLYEFSTYKFDLQTITNIDLELENVYKLLNT